MAVRLIMVAANKFVWLRELENAVIVHMAP